MKQPCGFCGHDLDTDAVGVCQRVSGWSQKRKDGRGGLRLAEYAMEWAHSECVSLAAKGVGAGQASLFEEAA